MAGVLPDGAGIIVGVGVGAAASAALEPAIEIPKQEAWDRNRNKILDAGLMARLVAQGGITLDAGRTSAHREGYDDDKFDHLVYLSQTVPGVGEALALWRLGLLGDDLFTHVLTKAGLDARYVAPIVNRKLAEVVGLGDVAYGVVRGILPTPSWVPVAPPTTGDKVPRFPQVDIDPLELAHKLGFDENMLRLMVGRSGLSMAPIMAANALFRGVIGPNDYLLAIAEGDLRTEWADAVRDTARQIPTASQFVQGHLRGWRTQAEMYAGSARHGMSKPDTDLLFQVERRPLNVHAITTGLARGGTFQPAAGEIQDPYEASVHQADLGPEWYDLQIANRYTYPSAFVLRALAQAGELGTTADVRQILLEIGWKPELATKVASEWTPVATGGDAHVSKAQTQLWTTTHTSYKAGEIDDATVTATLPAAGVDAASIPAVLDIWRTERALVRATLSAADIRKAYQKQDVNDATGVAWTIEQAVAALVARGWNAADAHQYLEIG